MKELSTKVVTNITQDRITFIRKQAEIRGIDIKADSGDVKYDNCVFNYKYDPKEETLSIKPSVPFFVSEEEFWGHVQGIIGSGKVAEQEGGHVKPRESTAPDAQLENVPGPEVVESEDLGTQPASGEPTPPTPEANL